MKLDMTLHTQILGEVLFNKVVMLATFAAMQRVWIDSHPDVDPADDARVQQEHRDLLAEAPEFVSVWDALTKRSARRAVTARRPPAPSRTASRSRDPEASGRA